MSDAAARLAAGVTALIGGLTGTPEASTDPLAAGVDALIAQMPTR